MVTAPAEGLVPVVTAVGMVRMAQEPAPVATQELRQAAVMCKRCPLQHYHCCDQGVHWCSWPKTVELEVHTAQAHPVQHQTTVVKTGSVPKRTALLLLLLLMPHRGA